MANHFAFYHSKERKISLNKILFYLLSQVWNVLPPSPTVAIYQAVKFALVLSMDTFYPILQPFPLVC